MAQILIILNTLTFHITSGFSILDKEYPDITDLRQALLLSGQRRVCFSVPGAAITSDLWMNQYSKDTGEAGADTSQQRREMFPSWQSWTKIFFNHRRNASLFTRWWLPQEVLRWVEKWKTWTVREGQGERDRGWSGWYYCAKVRKTQCVFGINEAVQQDGEGNRRQDGVELWSSALSRAYPITLPLPWVKMPSFSTLHPSLTASPQPTATQGHNWLVGQEHISSQQLTCLLLWLSP